MCIFQNYVLPPPPMKKREKEKHGVLCATLEGTKLKQMVPE